MRIGSLCTGYGGLDMAVQTVLGGELAFVADPDPGATAILAHHHPEVPNLGDITHVDWSDVEPVDVLTAGFPCQPVSMAGRRAGTTDERWLFDDITNAIRAMVAPPRLLVFENVPGLLTADGGDAMARVVEGLATLGCVGTYRVLRASDVGAPHRRERVFIVAWPSDSSGSGLEAGWEGRPGGGVDADAAHLGHERARLARFGRSGPAHRSHPVADASGDGWDEGRPEPAGLVWGPDAALGGGPDWGPYGPAVRRWERATGRDAPAPTEPGRTGQPRLSPRFVEWLMGLQEGHVTASEIGLTRNQQLHALGNGVVPQQGAAALRLLLGRATAGVAA